MTAGTIMFPIMAVLGLAQVSMGAVQKLFSEKTLGQRAMKTEDKMFGTHIANYVEGTRDLSQGTSAIKFDGKNKNGGKYTHSNILQNDTVLASKIFSESGSVGSLKPRDTKMVLKRIANIMDNDAVVTSDVIHTAVKKDLDTSRSVLLERTYGKGTDVKTEHKAIRKARMDAFRLPPEVYNKQDKEFGILTGADTSKQTAKRMANLPTAEVMKGKAWKDFTQKGTVGHKILNDKNIRNPEEVVRKLLEKKINEDASASVKTTPRVAKLSTADVMKGQAWKDFTQKGTVGHKILNDTTIRNPEELVRNLLEKRINEEISAKAKSA